MRLVFMGTPDFAVETLKALIAAGHDIACAYSQPPRPAGRGMAERPSPVHAFAAAQGIEVRTPASLKSADEQARFAALETDAAVVVAYGLLLPKPVLAAPRLGCFNVHASLLPRWRGAAPIQRAIMSGDAESGVTIMRMEEGLDTGPMCKVRRHAITPTTTAQSLHDELAALGARLMVEVLAQPEISCTPQPADGVTYARKIDKAEARIDLTRSAEEVRNHIHGLSPFPGAWFPVKATRLKALLCEVVQASGRPGTFLDDNLTIACGTGAIRLLRLQREGKGAMEATDFLRGFPIAKGTEAA
ncbi:methionyl-tRNA formyltransferase [Aestuariivirga litoralis]|uniref:Methionyl-tRNA formyltransferase n=1 Tax=Aestuariivirga litoralis TaxID=2650924 RepID=A0A2W2AMA8_9HYPH|nr:methionyl-tRNA formyltransferase [Aestuariivirga litoralis]PZF76531.1 methionyl-tRNA formyltransferase [Aestuariivirga litoralis]